MKRDLKSPLAPTFAKKNGGGEEPWEKSRRMQAERKKAKEEQYALEKKHIGNSYKTLQQVDADPKFASKTPAEKQKEARTRVMKGGGKWINVTLSKYAPKGQYSPDVVSYKKK